MLKTAKGAPPPKKSVAGIGARPAKSAFRAPRVGQAKITYTDKLPTMINLTLIDTYLLPSGGHSDRTVII